VDQVGVSLHNYIEMHGQNIKFCLILLNRLIKRSM